MCGFFIRILVIKVNNTIEHFYDFFFKHFKQTYETDTIDSVLKNTCLYSELFASFQKTFSLACTVEIKCVLMCDT